MVTRENAVPMLLENALAPKIIANKIHMIDVIDGWARFTLTTPPVTMGSEDGAHAPREVAGYVYFPVEHVPEAIGYTTFRLGHLWVSTKLPTWAGGNRLVA
jgi:hypothetical protein